MKDYTYSFEIKDLLTQFICAFDDVVIKRYDKNRVVKETIDVRYVLAPKQRVMYDIVNKAQNLTLPVVAVNVTGISRDTSRVFNKLDSVYNPLSETNNSNIKMPVPINIEVSMSILARYMQDMDQILSNFIPYNNPYIILSWKEPSIDPYNVVEIRSEVLWGGNISLTEPTDTTYSEKFRIVADTSFTIKGWLFKDKNSLSTPIYFANTNFIPVVKDLIIDIDNYSFNYDTLSANITSVPEIETVSISAIPTLTNIFYNLSGHGKLHEVVTNFKINNNFSNNFFIYGTNFDKVTTILLSSSNTITGIVSTINSPYTGSVTGTVLDPIYYNIVNDNIITISLPNIQEPCNFNFIICNPVGCTNSNQAGGSNIVGNNFTFRVPPVVDGDGTDGGINENYQMAITYDWRGTNQYDLDSKTVAFGEQVGWTCGDSGVYVLWLAGGSGSKDDTSLNGYERVDIRVDQARIDLLWSDSYNIECYAGWYLPAGGTGNAKISVRYRGITKEKTINPGTQSTCASTSVATVTVYSARQPDNSYFKIM